MVPMAGIGPATSPLPRECSTTEPHGQNYVTYYQACKLSYWSGRRGSNSRHSVWKTEALPTELHPHALNLSLNHAPLNLYFFKSKQICIIQSKLIWWRGKDSNLRTLRERIYSPSPLTTRPPLQTEPAIMLTI